MILMDARGFPEKNLNSIEEFPAFIGVIGCRYVIDCYRSS